MAPRKDSPNRLVVEGADDKHSIVHLMMRHGYDWDGASSLCPYVDDAMGVERLIEAIAVGVKARYRRLGFVLDADVDPVGRWSQVREAFRRGGLELPAVLPQEGVVMDGPTTGQRVGVWMMPDNVNAGALEAFVATLVPSADPVWTHAVEATERAIGLGAPLQRKDEMKGALCAWLAWQETPGMPFGTALKAQVFGHDSAEALRFVDWFERLFGER